MSTTLDCSRPGPRRRVRTLWLLLGIGIGALAANVSAQSVPARATEAKEDEAPVVLSPFVVETSQDVGYLAQNSLAGSRMNTKLTDLAVPTTAFTLELLQDIGTTSVDELVEYMASSRTDFPEGENIYWGDDRQRFRIRGLPAFNYSVNFFESSLRLDVFNTERIEQSRGPNSILFGLGSPGGVVNVSTKKANVSRTFTSVEQRFSDNDGLRTVLELNTPLRKDVLGFRLVGVRDHENSWRHHEYDNQDRLFATLGWRPFEKTRLDVEWEHGLVDKSTALPRGPIDAYSIWAATGKTLSNTPNAALGIARLTTANRLSIDTTTGAVSNVRNTNTTVVRSVGGVNAYVNDFSVFQKEAVIANGPAFSQRTNYTRGTAILSHTFTPELSVELAANYQKSHHDNIRGAGNNTLQIDTTVTLPNGQPNPNAGRAFTEGSPINSLADDLNKDLRASVAYELKLGRLGTHNIAALYQRSEIEAMSNQVRPQILVNPYSTASPDNAQNSVFFRTYYDLNGSPVNKTAGDWRRFDLNNIVDGAVVRQAKIISTIQGGQNNKFERDSAIGVIQSSFFNERLVTVAGYRIDWQDSYYSPTGFRGAPVAPFILGAYETPRSATPVEFEANNVTFSGLFRVTKTIALTYNKAENSNLPDPTAAIIAPDGSQRPPPPRGQSEDIGIKLNLGSRLSMNLLYFETAAQKDTANVNAAIERRYEIIWGALDAAGIPAPNGGRASEVPSLFNRYTFDSSASGYELELVANPTKNWRVFLNLSTLKLERTNIGQEGIAYLEKYRSYWLQGNNGRIRNDGSGGYAAVADDGDAVIETVAEEIAALDREIFNFYTVAEGEMPRGQNKRRLNLRTNYNFDSAGLKGFSVGGGLRYRSPEVVEYVATASGPTVSSTTTYGDSEFLVDLNVGYRGKFKFWGKYDVRWSAQLNVNNLLDQTDIVPLRTVGGVMVTYRFQPPREIFLTTKFDF